jgi:hypothetical protein
MGSDYFTQVTLHEGGLGQVIRWGRYTFPPPLACPVCSALPHLPDHTGAPVNAGPATAWRRPPRAGAWTWWPC